MQLPLWHAVEPRDTLRQVGMKAKLTRRLIAAAVLAAVVSVFHGPLLRGLAYPLIAKTPAGDFDSNYVGIICRTDGPDGDRCFDVAGKLLGEKSFRRLLLVGVGRDRLVETGVLPSFEGVARRELGKRGVISATPVIIPGDGNDYAMAAKSLAAWLRDNRNARVLLLCSQFRSAHLRRALDAALDRAQADQVRVRPLSDRRFDERNWWTQRPAWREFGIAWLIRLHGWLDDGRPAQTVKKTADQYEEDFLRSAGKATEATP